MRFCVLGSGSKGNCTYLDSGETALLIDAGFSGVEIARRLNDAGLDMARVKGILVTHEHADHVSGVGVLSRRYQLPVYANSGTKKAAGSSLAKLHAFLPFTTGISFPLAHLTIHPFAISHDTADPVGFTINDGRRTFGYCTDTGMISRLIQHHLRQCMGLVLECNHDLEMLKNGPYPPALQQRIRSKNGHLANPEAISCLAELVHDQLQHVVLAHISESNNCQERVRLHLKQILLPGTAVSLAEQHQAGEVITLR